MQLSSNRPKSLWAHGKFIASAAFEQPLMLDAADGMMSIPANEWSHTKLDPATVKEKLGNRSIVFVGLMGAGKTAIGRKVASMTGLDFIDSDHEIEEVSRMTVAELFENYGEDEFRALEMRVLARLLEEGPKVISTGGGAYMNDVTREAIRESGISVWLKADFEILMERVRRKQHRPLLQRADPEAVMRDLIDKRYPIYAEADVTVQSRDVPKDDVAREVIIALGKFMASETAEQTP